MMKNKKSGGFGKAKVATVLAFSIVFGIVMIQCNSTVDEEADLVSEKLTDNSSTEGIIVPVIAGREGTYYSGESDLINFTLVSDRLTIDGVSHEVDEIAEVIASSGLSDRGIVAIRADRNQKMELVRAIQTELKKINKRKVLYIGQSVLGQTIESALLLPPMPGMSYPGSPELPKIDDAYAAEYDIDILKIQVGRQEGFANHKNVYDFVNDQVAKSKSNYVVSLKYSDSDTYASYLQNWAYINEGFNQLYQERSQEMFGKNYLDLNKDIPEEKEQYNAVRKGIPRAISIAEKGNEDC